MIRLLPGFAIVGLLAVGLAFLPAEEKKPAQETTGKEALAPLQYLVGKWRGVGQVARGSTKGWWNEKSDWAWSFGKSGSALVTKVEDGKYFRELKLTPGKAAGDFELTGTTAEGKEVHFTGKRDEEEKLVVEVAEAVEGMPDRVTIRTVANGDRLLVLYEKKATTGWQRLGEVGSTRVGSGFGQGVAMRECVVTGGLGTIAVTYEGKTYYVCCTGCKDLFDENPADVLAEYRVRKEEEAKKRAEKDK